MAIRTINYDVSLDGISPAAQQFGGVQGDHNVTELKFTLDTSLMEAYSGVASMNNCMSGDFPLLEPGQNAVSWSGSVTKVEIVPNWRNL